MSDRNQRDIPAHLGQASAPCDLTPTTADWARAWAKLVYPIGTYEEVEQVAALVGCLEGIRSPEVGDIPDGRHPGCRGRTRPEKREKVHGGASRRRERKGVAEPRPPAQTDLTFRRNRGCMRRVSLPDVSTAHLRAAIVDRCSYAVVDDALSPTFPLGDALEVYVRREDAERFIEEVRGDEPELAKGMRNEERELQAGELN